MATVVKQHINVFHLPYLELFKSRGYEVHVCARNDFENKEDCVIPFCDKFYDLPFERFPLKKENIKNYKKLKQIIDDNRYDIIHCHTPVGGALTRLAAKKSREKGSRVVYTAHGFHFFKGAPIINWLLYYPIEKMMANYTDALITINNEDYQIAQKFKAKEIYKINGVGIDINKVTYIENHSIRKDLNIPDDATILLSVGELNKNKNHKTVIKALSIKNNPDIHYLICGIGHLETSLKEEVKRRGLEGNVHFLGYRRDIPTICNESDVFVFPSFREGLSLSLMEAMASGLPIIATDIRGNTDLIDVEKGGFLIKPKDINTLNEFINDLHQNNKKRERFAFYNINKIEKYSIKNVLKDIEKVYKFNLK